MATTPQTSFDLTPPSDDQLQNLIADLSDEERHVLLEHGTEAPFCGTFLQEKRPGVFTCRLCGLPLFHGGTLRAEKRAAEAGLDKAAADYQTTVLGAFQNVADSLHALELDAENLRAQSDAEQSAQKSLDLVRTQYKDGAASYLQVLDATRQ